MSKMVSARIPDAVYEQVNNQLKKLGATTTDLVNSAFEFVLQEHALPIPQKQKAAKHERRLTEEQAASLRDFFDNCCLNIEISSDIADDKKALRQAKIDKYEALT